MIINGKKILLLVLLAILIVSWTIALLTPIENDNLMIFSFINIAIAVGYFSFSIIKKSKLNK